MNGLLQDVLARAFTPPPMPPEAFPTGTRLVPGAHAALEIAWRAMFYQTLTTGIVLGAIGVLAVIVAVLARQATARAVADHLRGYAAHA